jgi:hypothetical protein
VRVGENVKGGASVLAKWPAKAVMNDSNGASSLEADANLTATAKRS